MGIPMGDGYDDYDEDGLNCSWCGGDAWEECDDWIQCTYRGCDGEMHPCSACGGTGDGRKQTVW
jgi:hypothetical protein